MVSGNLPALAPVDTKTAINLLYLYLSNDEIRAALSKSFVFVNLFGAVGDGVVDDTGAIQKAINAAAEIGGTVVFLPGDYRITQSLIIPPCSGLTLRGFYGRSRLLLSFENAQGFVLIKAESPAPPTRAISNLLIEQLIFDGQLLEVNRWLQTPSRTPITDPEADYYDAVLNPSGIIGNPAYPAVPAGICTSNTTSGALTIDGSLASGGQVVLGTLKSRRVTISSAGNASNAVYTITGTAHDGSALSVQLAGPNNTTAATQVVFATITAVSSSTTPGAAVEIGVRHADIFTVAAEGRRNAAYGQNVPEFIRLTCTVQTVIRNCEFRNSHGRGIFARGNKDLLIEDNTFYNIGKNDGPFHAVYVASYGAPVTVASVDGIVTSTSLAGELPLDGDIVDDGMVEFGVDDPRNVSITSTGDATNITITIEGTDAQGEAYTETVLGPNAETVYTIERWATVTRVVTSGVPGAAISVGYLTPVLSYFTHEEAPTIRNNRAHDLERSFLLFSPTKNGGQVVGNTIRDWGEAAIFIPTTVNADDGCVLIADNSFSGGKITDIVCWAIEAGWTRNLLIIGNRIENTEAGAVHVAGVRNVVVTNNFFRNCYKTHTVPYGPFAERYSFNIKAAPICGQDRPVDSGYIISVGSIRSSGIKNALIQSNLFRETRSSYPALFKQIKAGTNNIASTCVIANNTLDIPAGMTFLDKAINNVWESRIPLVIRNNEGHVSTAPVIITTEYTTADVTAVVTCGFRPSRVDVYLTPTGVSTAGRFSTGVFSWTPDATRNDFALVVSFDGSGQRAYTSTTDVALLVTTAGTTTWRIEFSSWQVDGFVVSFPVRTENVRVRWVCQP